MYVSTKARLYRYQIKSHNFLNGHDIFYLIVLRLTLYLDEYSVSANEFI